MLRILSVLLLSLGLVAQVHARDDLNYWPLEDALTSPGAKEKINPEIKLYFGKQKHPAVEKKILEVRTNKKTNGFNKGDKEACEWTFLSAIIALQERAEREGGNAVI